MHVGSIRACLTLLVTSFFAGLFIGIFPSSGLVGAGRFSSAATPTEMVLEALEIFEMEAPGSMDGPKNPRSLNHCFLWQPWDLV